MYKYTFSFLLLSLGIGIVPFHSEAATTTVQIFASSGDGAITSSVTAINWDVLKMGNNLDINSAATERNVYADPWAIRRLYFPFDTSSLPDNAQIVSATLHFTHPHNNYADNDNLSVGLVLGTQDSLTSLSSDKWGPKSFVRIAEDKDISTFTSANQTTSWPLNDLGTGAIDKGPGGITSLVLATSADIDDTNLGLSSLNYVDVYMSEQTGTSQDPYLEITYVDTWSVAAASDMKTEGTTNTQNVTDATPEFAAKFNSFNGIGKGTHYQIQVSTSSSNWDHLMWDSSKMPFTVALPTGSTSSEISYGGTTLTADETYYWRIKTWDQYSNESPWSTIASFTMDDELTVQIYPSAGDGAITSGGTSYWATLKAGNDLHIDKIAFERNVYVDPWAIRRLYFPFDTSVIPTDATISSASLNLVHPRNNYQDNDGFSIGLVEGRQSSTTDLTTNEWGTVMYTRLASDVDITSINTTNQVVSFPFNTSGIDAINTGPATSTSLVIATSPDIDNSSTGLTSLNYVDFYMSEGPFKPHIEITYSR